MFLQVDQVTKSFGYPYCTQRFSLCFQPFFNNFVPPLNLMDNLAFRNFNGTGAGHCMDHECNDAKCLWKFSLKGL